MPVSHLTNSAAEMMAAALNTLTGGSFSHLTTSEAEMLARIVTEMTGEEYSHLTTGVETLWELMLTQAASDGITFDRSNHSSSEIMAIIANGVISGGGEEYEGPLDLVAGATLAYSAARALSADMVGQPYATLRRASDSAELEFEFEPDGSVPSAAIATWAGGAASVQVWNDHSGNGADLSAVADNTDGTWTASVLNSKPGIVWGNSSGMENAGPVSFPNGAVSFFMVVKNGEEGALDLVVGAASYLDIKTGAGAYLDMIAEGNEAGGSYNAQFEDDTFYLADGAWQFGSASYRLNGVALTRTANWDSGAIGAISGVIQMANEEAVSLCELILYPTLLSDADRLTLRQNIASFYGITLP